MNASTNPCQPTSTASPSDDAWARGVLRRQVDMLGELAEDGRVLAKAIQRRGLEAAGEAPEAQGAEAQAGAVPAEAAVDRLARGDISLAFHRVARAVRLCLMLQAKLVQEITGAKSAPRLAACGEEPCRRGQVFERKQQARQMVERAAQAEHENIDTVERLVREAGDRLDREDLEDRLLSRPVGELVAEICQTLGLKPDCRSWPPRPGPRRTPIPTPTGKGKRRSSRCAG